MKLWIFTFLALTSTLNGTAFAERLADSDEGFLFGPPPKGEETQKVAQQDQEKVIPAPPVRVQNVEVAKPEVSTAADESFSLDPNELKDPKDKAASIDGCYTPSVNTQITNPQVIVPVNQLDQTISIETPDRAEPVVAKVSTGGGLKIPNGSIKKGPYCARTPRMDRRIIRAITASDFKGTSCTPDQIRDRATVFPMYHTRTFTDKNDNPIPMPKAIRIDGGIFFHEVPPSYRGLLGQNVSGECVRLDPKTAKFLFDQIQKYGAIEVSISEPPEVSREMPQYCDARMVAQARGDLQSGRLSQAQATGSEDVYGGVGSFTNLLGRAVTGVVQVPTGIATGLVKGVSGLFGGGTQRPSVTPPPTRSQKRTRG